MGAPDETRPGVEAAVRLSPAVAKAVRQTRMVTRTAVEEEGVAKDTTLRTAEAIPVGTEFCGEIHVQAAAGSAEDLAWRLALLSIPAIGGGRNRGRGACLVSIGDEVRSPGALLQAVDEEVREGLRERPLTPSPGAFFPSDKPIVLRLFFQSQSPICCPQIPDKTNVIATGFSIPASAVQGVIVSRLSARRPGLGDALMDSSQFRVWPLQPCAQPWPDETESADGELDVDQLRNLPTSIRVSLTHRAAKYSLSESHSDQDFFDESLEGLPWPESPDGAPLKASDGVLLRWASGERKLWKAGAMPHTISSHGVHADLENAGRRNLFTVDAMAPLVWRGLVVMPEDAAHELLDSLQADPLIAVGKSRSVRGIGTLRAFVAADGIPEEWQTHTAHTVLIAQSPLLLPDQGGDKSADEELHALAREWADRNGLPQPERRPWANVGLLFGWNRHGGGCQQACRVALPGSVIAFSQQLPDAQLAQILITDSLGCGSDRGQRRGWGAVCVHPDKAQDCFSRKHVPHAVGESGDKSAAAAVRLVLDMRRDTQWLPSPSQIRAVQQRLEKSGPDNALEYLRRQVTGRTSRIWFTWESSYDRFRILFTQFDKNTALRAFDVLADLAVLREKEGRQ